ncbi:ATPase family AAA domain-containing protein 5-like [Uloborus diversus]|uniref:ATPase family AAA domain-containing protein 5-like n=1 Tax=Uloborus diversus TaxID=327109 RepID=UPI00240A2B81|nr:ATPase family AAA domain-containing protein 5-like [Uloborus diversus]
MDDGPSCDINTASSLNKRGKRNKSKDNHVETESTVRKEIETKLTDASVSLGKDTSELPKKSKRGRKKLVPQVDSDEAVGENANLSSKGNTAVLLKKGTRGCKKLVSMSGSDEAGSLSSKTNASVLLEKGEGVYEEPLCKSEPGETGGKEICLSSETNASVLMIESENACKVLISKTESDEAEGKESESSKINALVSLKKDESSCEELDSKSESESFETGGKEAGLCSETNASVLLKESKSAYEKPISKSDSESKETGDKEVGLSSETNASVLPKEDESACEKYVSENEFERDETGSKEVVLPSETNASVLPGVDEKLLSKSESNEAKSKKTLEKLNEKEIPTKQKDANLSLEKNEADSSLSCEKNASRTNSIPENETTDANTSPENAFVLPKKRGRKKLVPESKSNDTASQAANLSNEKTATIVSVKGKRGRKELVSKNETVVTESKEALTKLNGKEVLVDEDTDLSLEKNALVLPKKRGRKKLKSVESPKQVSSAENIDIVSKKRRGRKKKKMTHIIESIPEQKDNCLNSTSNMDHNLNIDHDSDLNPKKRQRKNENISDILEENILSHRRSRRLMNDSKNKNQDLEELDCDEKVSKRKLKPKSKQALASIKKAKSIVNKIKQRKVNSPVPLMQDCPLIKKSIALENKVKSNAKLFPIFSSPSSAEKGNVSEIIKQDGTNKSKNKCKDKNLKTSRKSDDSNIVNSKKKLKKTIKDQKIIDIDLSDDHVEEIENDVLVIDTDSFDDQVQKDKNDLQVIELPFVNSTVDKVVADVPFKKTSTKISVEPELVCYPTFSHCNPTCIYETVESLGKYIDKNKCNESAELTAYHQSGCSVDSSENLNRDNDPTGNENICSETTGLCPKDEIKCFESTDLCPKNDVKCSESAVSSMEGDEGPQQCDSSDLEDKNSKSKPVNNYFDLDESGKGSKFKFVNSYNAADTDYLKIPTWDKTAHLLDDECSEHLNSKKEAVNINVESDCVFGNELNQNISDKKHEQLWTDFMCSFGEESYSNQVVVNEIKSWLSEWKCKFNKNSRKSQDEDSSSSFSSDSCDSDCSLSNSIIISGIPGSGKTSMVFSLAHQLGFKVLEVNASTCRSGRNISLRLKEALESYHVENIEVMEDVSKEECRNDASSKRKDAKIKELGSVTAEGTPRGKSKKRTKKKTAKDSETDDEDCGKIVKKKRTKKKMDKDSEMENDACSEVFECNKKENIKNYFKLDCSKVVKQAPKNLMNFFGPGKSKKATTTETLNLPDVVQNEKLEKNLYKISSSTIILFDDVDVIFEEDEGFWGTVKGFLQISKKPVIFTVSRNVEIVKANLNMDIKVFDLSPMPESATVEKLKTITKQYVESSTINFQLLLSESANDLRKSILNAQFWTKKSGPTRSSKNVKTFYQNSFVLGLLDFKSDEINRLLFKDSSSNLPSVILDYHKKGYDLLHGKVL